MMAQRRPAQGFGPAAADFQAALKKEKRRLSWKAAAAGSSLIQGQSLVMLVTWGWPLSGWKIVTRA